MYFGLHLPLGMHQNPYHQVTLKYLYEHMGVRKEHFCWAKPCINVIRVAFCVCSPWGGEEGGVDVVVVSGGTEGRGCPS